MTTIHDVFKFKGLGPHISDDHIDQVGNLRLTITFIKDAAYCCVEPECFLGLMEKSAKWMRLDGVYGIRVETIEVIGKVQNGVLLKELNGISRQRLEEMEYSVQFTRVV